MASSNQNASRCDLVNELIRSAEVLNSLHCLPATDGNLSARLDADTVLITTSGIEKRLLSESSFVVARLSESRPAVASSEWPMHRSLYKTRPDVNCVLHAHPPYLTSFAVTDFVPDTHLLAETELLIGRIVRVPFVPPGSAALADALLTADPAAAVYLLSNHGALSVGGSITEALHRMERAEFLARVQIQAACLGGGVPTPKTSSRTKSNE